ncbi:DUF86 domain-containing protein [Marinomonas sp. C2222]|uniref:DUF86 domain-containing protein n=1 Tax=Marinomonas sargassi TaxID=2984494 RepID=A0ABT2YQD8_9GAMM|nr:DUF86 domain-containing protein [Marinomonas sargassi]MCV2402103.1 DUF86 domain-containing protein [Marinomonas sargassi]
MNDAIINKFATIERCIKRIKEVYEQSKDHFDNDYTSQDSIILNLQRACEACIDVANIVNKQHRTGIPQSGRDSFELLKKAGLLSPLLAESLQKMVGLRNIAVHDYQTLNLEIVKHVVENKLGEFTRFIEEMKGTE